MVHPKSAECGEEIRTKTGMCPTCGSSKYKKTYLLTFLLTTSLVSGGAGYFIGISGNDTISESNPEPNPKKTANSDVQLLDFSYSKGGYGNIMEASFTIYNKGPYYVKDIIITCAHFAKSGTLIDGNQKTIYDTVPPRSQKRIKDFNMGPIHTQADKTQCEITDFKN